MESLGKAWSSSRTVGSRRSIGPHGYGNDYVPGKSDVG